MASRGSIKTVKTKNIARTAKNRAVQKPKLVQRKKSRVIADDVIHHNEPAGRFLMTNDAFAKSNETMMKACEDLNGIMRDISQAAMQSANALQKGMSEMAQCSNELMQQNMARSMSVSKSMMAVKSPRDVMDMQTSLARECFDGWMSNAGRMSEVAARMMRDVVDPMAQQTNAAMSKAMSSLRKAA